ncbi:unnamed protein product [Parnassius apollo]|uniref:(apollo) hypothetical protein n=1 Tax=Parnassius apollo TaxID=110799 RepID=A0A8S3W3F8_PARAO|nr:unnamed protein product [Parnassius apollo]
MVGYGETVKEYRIYFSHGNDVELKRDVVFLEKEQNYSEIEVKLNYTEENNDKSNELHNESETTSANLDETMVMLSMSEESGSEYSPSEANNSSVEPIDEVCQREPSKRIRKPPVYYHCQNVHTEQCEPVTYARERLVVTLRYLATGDSYTSLQYLFRISKQSISKIIPQNTEAIIGSAKGLCTGYWQGYSVKSLSVILLGIEWNVGLWELACWVWGLAGWMWGLAGWVWEYMLMRKRTKKMIRLDIVCLRTVE